MVKRAEGSLFGGSDLRRQGQDTRHRMEELIIRHPDVCQLEIHSDLVAYGIVRRDRIRWLPVDASKAM